MYSAVSSLNDMQVFSCDIKCKLFLLSAFIGLQLCFFKVMHKNIFHPCADLFIFNLHYHSLFPIVPAYLKRHL